MNVVFKHNNGREQVMGKRFAVILQKLGRGVFQSEGKAVDTSARAFPGTDDMRSISDVDAYIKAENSARERLALDLSDMNIEELHALAKERGVKVHHKAGADKVREALREAV